jgi:hypothetical protein
VDPCAAREAILDNRTQPDRDERPLLFYEANLEAMNA